MAMAEALPPDASTASTGLGLRYIGDWAYAFSGAFNSTTSSRLILQPEKVLFLLISSVMELYAT